MSTPLAVIVELARKHFPYPTPNPGQLESIVRAVDFFINKGKKHVIVEAPTGIGKTAIATTVHRVMRELFPEHRTTVSTATKGLQDQYAEDDKLVYDLKGKNNYTCPHDKGPYNSGSCRAHVKQGKCQKSAECPYVKRRFIWCNKAELRVTNNSFQIEACPSICMEEDNRANLIIIDECDVIDDNLVSHTTIRLHARDYEDLKMYGYGGLVQSIKDYSKMFRGIPVGVPFNISMEAIQAMADLHGEVVEIVKQFETMIENEERQDHEQLGSIIETLQQICDKTEIFSQSDDGEWILSEYEYGLFVELKPVYASQVAHYGLFRKADMFLHLSATICGFESYAKTLGIKEGQYATVAVDNPIPLDNRRTYLVPEVKVSGNIDYDKLASLVDQIVDQYHGQNGIIHTVSFALAKEIMSRTKHRQRMMVSGDRAEIISEMQRGKGRVILSPSIERGYDFKGDLSRFQILLKVPYLYLGDPLISLNTNRHPRWYARKAILRMVQSCGRSIRGVQDYADTYILDSNMLRLLRDNKDLFPQWFIDSLVISD